MRRRTAFTLVELSVVVGIVAALLAMTVPAVSKARATAQLTRCAGNLHQIGNAMAAYAAANKGRYPMNSATLSASGAIAWYDAERIGTFLPAVKSSPTDLRPGGGVYVCPEDVWGVVRVSYAMNVWAGSYIDKSVLTQSPASARQWSARVANASQMILLGEAYSGLAGPAGTGTGYYVAPAAVGVAYATAGAPTWAQVATTAGQRFGGAGGVLYTAGRYGKSPSELCFSRHRVVPGPVSPTLAKGRLNIAYADGHVSLRSDGDLVTPAGLSTGDSWWSPADR